MMVVLKILVLTFLGFNALLLLLYCISNSKRYFANELIKLETTEKDEVFKGISKKGRIFFSLGLGIIYLDFLLLEKLKNKTLNGKKTYKCEYCDHRGTCYIKGEKHIFFYKNNKDWTIERSRDLTCGPANFKATKDTEHKSYNIVETLKEVTINKVVTFEGMNWKVFRGHKNNERILFSIFSITDRNDTRDVEWGQIKETFRDKIKKKLKKEVE